MNTVADRDGKRGGRHDHPFSENLTIRQVTPLRSLNAARQATLRRTEPCPSQTYLPPEASNAGRRHLRHEDTYERIPSPIVTVFRRPPATSMFNIDLSKRMTVANRDGQRGGRDDHPFSDNLTIR